MCDRIVKQNPPVGDTDVVTFDFKPMLLMDVWG
jgi:hypothetical protein